MTPSPSDQGRSTPEQTWKMVLDQLQLQMTQATFETWVKNTRLISQNGHKLVIDAKSVYAKDWLENRLYNTIIRTVANILDHPVELEFVIGETQANGNIAATHPFVPHIAIIGEKTGYASLPYEESEEPEPEAPASDHALVPHIALMGGKTGYAPTPHYYINYWKPYLARRYKTAGRNAFDLWQALRAGHRVKVKSKYFTEWTPVVDITYEELGDSIGIGYVSISGRKDHCVEYEQKKEQGLSLECCGRYEHHEIGPSVRTGEYHCYFWRIGALDVLDNEDLLAVDSVGKNRYHTMKLQVWHSLPILTPFQAEYLPRRLQDKHMGWLQKAALPDKLNFDLDEWSNTPLTEETFLDRGPRRERSRTLHGRYQRNPFQNK